MASKSSRKPGWVTVKTTLPTRPLPPNSSRLPVTTERLIIRALVPSDLQSLHSLRTQPEIMAHNPQGRPDRDLEETKPRLDAFLPPRDETTYNFAICLRETGDQMMIGIGGCHNLATAILGWPVVGYMIHKDYWGCGLATEFLHAWLDMWSALPREEVKIQVDPRTLNPNFTVGNDDDGGGLPVVKEQMTAWTVSTNPGSQRVLIKGGFEHFLTWTEPDLRDPTVDIELVGHRFFPTGK